MFLEGGGLCFADSECTSRLSAQPLLGSSTGMPASCRGSALLADAGVFAGAALLVAHCCGWLLQGAALHIHHAEPVIHLECSTGHLRMVRAC